MAPRSSEPTTAPSGRASFISQVFRKVKEPKSAKESGDDDNDDDESENDCPDEQQQNPREALAAAATAAEKGGEDPETEHPQKRSAIPRTSSRSSKISSRRQHKLRSNKSASTASSQLTANSLAMKLEGGSIGKTNNNNGEGNHDEDRSVATSSSRRSTTRGGGGRHRLSSRNRAMNISTDSFRDLLGDFHVEGEDEPEEDLLDASSKSANTGVQRTRSRRTGDRLRSRRQTSERGLLSKESRATEKDVPSSPRKVSTRRHQGASEHKSKGASNIEGEEDPPKKRNSAGSRSDSRLRRTKSHTSSRSNVRDQESSLTATDTPGRPSERKHTSTAHEKHRRSRSKSINRSSRTNGTRSRSKSAAKTSGISSSRHRTRSSPKQQHSRRRGESVDRKKHNSHRKLTATKSPGDPEKKSSGHTRRPRGASKHGELKHRVKKHKDILGASTSRPSGRDAPTVPSSEIMDESSRMDNSTPGSPDLMMDESSRLENSSSSVTRGRMDESSKMGYNNSLTYYGEMDERSKMGSSLSAIPAVNMDEISKIDKNASAVSLSCANDMFTDEKHESQNSISGMNHSIKLDNHASAVFFGAVEQGAEGKHNESVSSTGLGVQESFGPQPQDESEPAGSPEQAKIREISETAGWTMADSFKLESANVQVPSRSMEATLANEDSNALKNKDETVPNKLGDASVLPADDIEDSVHLEKDGGCVLVAGGTTFRKVETGAASDLSSSESTLSKTMDDSNSNSSDYDYNEPRKYSMGEIVQFDPTQAGGWSSVKQISSEKTDYEINGQSGHIGEIVDPVSNLQQVTQRNAPLFDLLDDSPEMDDFKQDEAPASSVGPRRRKHRFSLRRTKSQCSDDGLLDKEKVSQEEEATPVSKEEVTANALGYNEDTPSDFFSPTQTKEKKKALFNEMLERMRSKGRTKSNGSETRKSSGSETRKSNESESSRGYEGTEAEPKITPTPRFNGEESLSELLSSPTPKEKKKNLYDMLADNTDEDSVDVQQTPNTAKEKKRTLAKKASGYLQKMLNSSSSNIQSEGGDDKSIVSSSTNRSGKKSLKNMFASSSKNRKNRGQLLPDASSITGSLADEELLYDHILKTK